MPFCLTEEGKSYYYWHYRHNFTCSFHQVFLVDRCYFCSKMFDNSILVSMCCSYCKAPLNNYDSHISYEMKFKIADYFLVDDSPEMLTRKIRELEPFFEIMRDGSFDVWRRKNRIHIYEQVFFLNTIIAFYFENKLMDQYIESFIINSDLERFPDVLPRKIKYYLNPNKFLFFTRRVQTSLLKLADSVPDFQVSLEWFENIFQRKYSALFYAYNGFYSEMLIDSRSSSIYLSIEKREKATVSLRDIKKIINKDFLY